MTRRGEVSRTDEQVRERVEALLAQLTTAEKVAQLGSVWLRPDGDGDVAPESSSPDLTQRRSFAQQIDCGLGQLTRTWGTVPLTVAEGIEAMRERQRAVIAANRFGIPAIAHEECLTGFTAWGATVYPTALAWGATFHPELIEQMAHAIGDDMARVGVHQALSPVLDVVHDYRWGRVEETIGEDPYLVGTIGAAYVKGLEDAGIIATLKHFAGYSASVAALNHGPVRLGPRHLRDVVLVPFEMAIKLGGARSVMNSYTDVDGIPCAADRRLLTDLLRGEWGFTGTVVSDYFAVRFLQDAHFVAATRGDAAALALNAGLDVELPGTDAFAELPAQVDAGAVAPEALDEAVRRVLTQKAELGLLEPGWQPRLDADVDLDSPANRALARRIAEESIVLVANDGTLPLSAAMKLAVIGPVAGDGLTMMGCYAFPNHVLKHHPGVEAGIALPTIAQAIAAEFDQVSYAPGCGIDGPGTAGFAAAVEAASAADVAVVTVGDLAGLFGVGTSGEGNDVADLRLPGVQAELVEAVLATGTPVVLVVSSGRPYALGGLAERCAAVVQAFFPGEEGAGALAGLLAGRVAPSGRLPVGIPRVPGASPWTYLLPPLGRRRPSYTSLDPDMAFPFGHGLSYTSFELDDLALSSEEIAPDGTLEIAATVTNTGPRAGVHVVQLYLRDEVAQVTTPVKRLVGYARVELAPGESRRVTFSLHADRTAFTGVDLARVVEPGWFTVWVGDDSEDDRLSARFRIAGDLRRVAGDGVLVTPVTVS